MEALPELKQEGLKILLKGRTRIVDVIEELNDAVLYNGLTTDCVRNCIAKLQFVENEISLAKDIFSSN